MTVHTAGGFVMELDRTEDGQPVTIGIEPPDEIQMCLHCTLPDCRPNSVTCPDGALDWVRSNERRTMRRALREARGVP